MSRQFDPPPLFGGLEWTYGSNIADRIGRLCYSIADLNAKLALEGDRHDGAGQSRICSNQKKATSTINVHVKMHPFSQFISQTCVLNFIDARIRMY